MKATISIITMSVAILLSSCNFQIVTGIKGNGNVVTQERNVTEEFNQVKGSTGLDVYLTQGNENKITVEADENLLEYIETNIENGKLHIKTSKNIGRSKSNNIYVTFKEITSIEASSGADVEGNSVIKSEILSLKSSSGADLNVEVFAKELTAKTSSGAEIEVTGKTPSLAADASSGSEINAKELLVINCKAEASSGAKVTVNVKEKLDTHVSSGGDVNYYGNPLSVNSNKSHSGSVKKM